jgi:hypothetical protein
MAGLVPATHDLRAGGVGRGGGGDESAGSVVMGPRDKPGDDGEGMVERE